MQLKKIDRPPKQKSGYEELTGLVEGVNASVQLSFHVMEIE